MWMAACLLFVFGALIEYSAVNVMYRKDKIAQEKLEAAQKRREMQQMRNNVDHHGDCGDYSDTEKMFMEHANDEVGIRLSCRLCCCQRHFLIQVMCPSLPFAYSVHKTEDFDMMTSGGMCLIHEEACATFKCLTNSGRVLLNT